MAGPSLRGFVPPDKLLALRPRSALGIGRCAVVHNALVLGPRPRPVAIDGSSVQLIALRARKIRRLFRKDSAIDPASTRRRAVARKLGRTAQLTPLAEVIPIYLPEYLLGIGLALDPEIATLIVPGEVSQRRITLEGRIFVECFEPLTQIVGEPRIGAAVARRQYGSIVPLDHALRIRERAVLFYY